VRSDHFAIGCDKRGECGRPSLDLLRQAGDRFCGVTPSQET
jgi:hypothetical protein